MTDSHTGWYGREVAEGGLAPLEKGVALPVARELEGSVEVVSIRGAEFVDLDRVVDDKLGGLEGVDFLRVPAEGSHSISHSGQIDDSRHTREVLHQDAGGHIRDLARGLGLWVPVGEEADVVVCDCVSVLVAEKIFEQDAEAVRQACEINGGIEVGQTL